MQRAATASIARPAASGPAPVRARADLVDRRILAQTLDIVAECGLEGLSITALCSRAGISRATFYRRFSSPAGALAEAINAAFAFDALPRSKDPVDYLIEYTRATERAYADRRVARAIALMAGEVSVRPGPFAHVQDAMQERRAHVRRTAEALGVPGEGADPVPDLDLILLVLSGLAAEAALSGQPLEDDALRGIIARLLR